MGIHYELAHHAEQRIRQRGLKEDDLSMLLECSSAIDREVLQLLDGDVEREITKRKREIRQLERLRGCQVVVAGRVVVTAYRPSRRRTQRNLRRRRAGADRASRKRV